VCSSDLRQPLIDAVVVFFEIQISPLTLMAFEIALLGVVREMGRQLLELVLNVCEPDRPSELPKDVWFECGGYRRRRARRQRTGAWHRGLVISSCTDTEDRSWQAGDGSIFPLEMLLGLNHSATPALEQRFSQAGTRRWTRRHYASGVRVQRLSSSHRRHCQRL